jgi:hypothetical protein
MLGGGQTPGPTAGGIDPVAAATDGGMVSQTPDTNWLRYANQGATRSKPLSANLTKSMSFLPELGVEMEVFSGGQDAKGEGLARLGSTRHDHGNAADVFFYKDGRKLDWANEADVPVFQEIVKRGRKAGLTGFGAGPGYMQPGSMHLGFGKEAVWGAGGSGANAPSWLKDAYNSSGPQSNQGPQKDYSTMGRYAPTIAQAAQKWGVDPEIALRVAQSEGGLNDWIQSGVAKGGRREPSFGPFQLLVGGGDSGFPEGMGNQLLKERGIDPRDPNNADAVIDFAMEQASKKGWGQWYGAAKAGVGKFDGIRGPQSVTDNAPNKTAGYGDRLKSRMFGGSAGGMASGEYKPGPLETMMKTQQQDAGSAVAGGRGGGSVQSGGSEIPQVAPPADDANAGYLEQANASIKNLQQSGGKTQRSAARKDQLTKRTRYQNG